MICSNHLRYNAKTSQNPSLVFSFDPAANVLGDSKLVIIYWNISLQLRHKPVYSKWIMSIRIFSSTIQNFMHGHSIMSVKLQKRYHFFAFSFNEAEFKDALKNKNTTFFNKLDKKYLGFHRS